MYTTTQRSVFPGPVTTFSVNTGAAACWVTQLGSFAMSIGFIFGGVPVYVTLPLMVPAAPAGAAGTTMAGLTSAPVTSAVTRTETECVRIRRPLYGKDRFTDSPPAPAPTPRPTRTDGLELRGVRRQPCLPERGLGGLQGLQRPEKVHQVPGVRRLEVVGKRGHGGAVESRHEDLVQVLVGDAAHEA